MDSNKTKPGYSQAMFISVWNLEQDEFRAQRQTQVCSQRGQAGASPCPTRQIWVGFGFKHLPLPLISGDHAQELLCKMPGIFII